MDDNYKEHKDILDVATKGLGIPSELIVKASKDLEEDIKKDLQIPDPPKEKIVNLAGSGKLLGILRPKE